MVKNVPTGLNYIYVGSEMKCRFANSANIGAFLYLHDILTLKRKEIEII
jgi:hypothetical protein